MQEMSPEQRLADLGWALPKPAAPGFDYVPLTLDAGTLYLSAQIAKVDGELSTRGRVGESVSVEEAKAAMRICALQGLAWLRHELGTLDAIQRVLRLNAYVACAPGCGQLSEIADVASGMLVAVLGDDGRHARTVLGVAELPRDAPCMFDATLSVAS